MLKKQEEKQIFVENLLTKRKMDVESQRKEKEVKVKMSLEQILQKHEEKRLRVEQKMESIYLKESARTLPSTSVYLGG